MQVENIIKNNGQHLENLSHYFWNISWANHFPKKISESLKIEYSCFEVIEKFINTFRKEILGNENVLFSLEHQSKTKYYQITSDHFVFKDNDKVVGIFIGSVFDWSTYYYRFAYILPDYHKLGFYKEIISYLQPILRDRGVSEVLADIKFDNNRNLKFLLQNNFQVEGMLKTSRWGTIIRLNKNLNDHLNDQ